MRRAELIEHIKAQHVLWYDWWGESLRWGDDRRMQWEECVTDPNRLLPLVPEDRTDITMQIEVIPFGNRNTDAYWVWTDDTIHIIAARGVRGLTAFGPLERNTVRRRLDRADVAVVADAGGRWVVWIGDDYPTIAWSWSRVVELVEA